MPCADDFQLVCGGCKLWRKGRVGRCHAHNFDSGLIQNRVARRLENAPELGGEQWISVMDQVFLVLQKAIFPGEVADFGVAAAGDQVGQEEGVIAPALERVPGDGAQQGAGFLDGQVAGALIRTRLKPRDGVGWVGWAKWGVGLIQVRSVGVERGKGGQALVEGVGGEAGGALGIQPQGDVGAGDLPGQLAGLSEEGLPGMSVSPAGVWRGARVEPQVEGLYPPGLPRGGG